MAALPAHPFPHSRPDVPPRERAPRVVAAGRIVAGHWQQCRTTLPLQSAPRAK